MKTILGLSAVFLAATLTVRPAAAVASGAPAAGGSGATTGSGTTEAPGGASQSMNPAAPSPASPNAPLPDVPDPNPMPAPVNPNPAVNTGVPAKTPANAPATTTPGLTGAGQTPVIARVPLPDISAAIQNPLVTTQAGASASGQTVGPAVGQTGSQTGIPGGPPPVNVQKLKVLRQGDAVVISGTVHTQQDKDAAGARAAAAANGEQVINNITVQ